MARIERTVTIAAPVEEAFSVARDIERLWTAMPDVGVSNVVQTPEVVGSRAEWKARVVGPLHMEGQVEYTEVVPPERIVVKSSTGPTFTFTFKPSEGGTEAKVVCEWTFDTPLVGAPLEGITKLMSQHDIATFMTNLKAAVEGVPPAQDDHVSAGTPGGRLARSVTIDAPVERVFADLLNLGTFWAGGPDVATREVSLTPEGVGSSARIYSHWLGLHMEGVIEIVDVAPHERVVMKASFGLEGPTWTFTVEQVAGGTELVGEGEWHVGVPGAGRRLESWAAAMHDDFLEGMLHSAKERVESAA